MRTNADAEFLVEHRPFVLRLCRILMRDADESEDVAQQVFLRAYRSLGEGVRPLNARAWLAQIARNECRSRARTAAARPESPLPEGLPAGGLDPAELAAQHALVVRLQQELADLPARQREAVLLREFRGLSYRELAAEMGETGPAVESLLQRARRRLVERLDGSRRPFVGVAFVVEWVRSVVARLSPAPGAAEAVTAGGAAAVVAKLTAAGVVTVGVGVAGGDVRHETHVPTAPVVRPQLALPVSEAAARTSLPVRRSVRSGAGRERGEERGRDDDRSGPEEPRRDSGPGGAPSPSSDDGSSSSGSASSGSGSGGSGSSGPGPGTTELSSSGESSGSGDSGSGSDSLSSGPGSGSNTTSSSGPSSSSGSDSSGSSGSGSDGTSGHSGSGSSGSGD